MEHINTKSDQFHHITRKTSKTPNKTNDSPTVNNKISTFELKPYLQKFQWMKPRSTNQESKENNIET